MSKWRGLRGLVERDDAVRADAQAHGQRVERRDRRRGLLVQVLLPARHLGKHGERVSDQNIV